MERRRTVIICRRGSRVKRQKRASGRGLFGVSTFACWNLDQPRARPPDGGLRPVL